MPAINFRRQCVPMIESGEKIMEICPPGAYMIEPGDSIQLFTGMYTHAWTLIMNTVCVENSKFYIFTDHMITINGHLLKQKETSVLASSAGYSSEKALIDYIAVAHGIPFQGELIRWKPREVSNGTA